jgi:two-component system sensor histidine kinase BaeS
VRGTASYHGATLATLTEQSQRLHRVAGDLSAVSRAEERQLNLHPALITAQDLISGAIAAARPRFDAKGISLTPGATVDTCQVLVDHDRLAEALGALLDNALRHTGTGAS